MRGGYVTDTPVRMGFLWLYLYSILLSVNIMGRQSAVKVENFGAQGEKDGRRSEQGVVASDLLVARKARFLVGKVEEVAAIDLLVRALVRKEH